ncbi:MAG: polynucleotidyl transferase [Synechococcus sp. Baikal-G1]|nr:MAG: polynucleotidyl transferase [Synechococcus sp. Baikal-G1]
MTGWLLILALLVLGGVLSTLGDRLGSLVGKSRLSLFNLRPRKTAVLITVMTGSLISALSLGLMLLVSQQLRVGLFELDRIEHRLRDSRTSLGRSQAELKRSHSDLLKAEKGRKQARQLLAEAERQARSLRAALGPLMQQRLALEKQRDQLNRDIRSKDADIQRNQQELAQVKGRIVAAGKELKELEANLLALRRGDVVISSGQSLVIAKVKLQKSSQSKEVIEALLQQANKVAFQRVLPGESQERQVLLVPRGDIAKLEDVITKPGTWVVSIVSAGNVLRGERRVMAFPDVRPNRQVVRQGDQMATTVLEAEERSPQEVQSRLNLLLAATFTRAQRQGALADGLQYDLNNFNRLGTQLRDRPAGQTVRLEAVSLRDSDIADPLVIELRWLQAPGIGQAGAAAGRNQP